MKRIHNRWVVSELQNRDRNGEWIIHNMDFINISENPKDGNLFISNVGCEYAAHNTYMEYLDGELIRRVGTVRRSSSNACHSCQFEQINAARRESAKQRTHSKKEINAARTRRRIEVLREAREAGLDPEDLF